VNPISAFFVRNMAAVYFFYGLAFFVMGLALAMARRGASQLRFAAAIGPLAAFGIVHGIHEWVEMFQLVGALISGHTPTIAEEWGRLALLTISFLMLLAFATILLSPQSRSPHQPAIIVGAMASLWAVSVLIVAAVLRPEAAGLIGMADVLARYLLGIPGALLGSWALMAQQRAFREQGMPQFGQDLVWAAIALFLYGVVGQFFVRPSPLPPSTIINAPLFLQLFGMPVQIFRALMAVVIAFYVLRALNAFAVEDRRRLENALEVERLATREMERLNEELRLTTRELSLLQDLSNLLATPMALADALHAVLEKTVGSLAFPGAGLILLVKRAGQSSYVAASVGFSSQADGESEESVQPLAEDLGQQCIARGLVICRHVNGTIFEFLPDDALARQECRRYPSPAMAISFPLIVRGGMIGSLTLSWATRNDQAPLPYEEYRLMLGIAQQLALPTENARLRHQAQDREKMLADLLRQTVGAQEAERQRIARELHDATGQSLTAIALGLRGVESMLPADPPVASAQIKELRSFSTIALGELRQIISDLRPSQLDDLGLVAALQWYVQEFETRRSINTEFIVEGSGIRLPTEYETVLFRITQEALTNVAKHAQATTVTVTLQFSAAQICLTVEDDGRGFDPDQAPVGGELQGWGLRGVQERTLLLGGHCEIKSAPGQGTRITATVPLVEDGTDADSENEEPLDGENPVTAR
jgi:signal transduction histidine kinase